MPFVHQHPEWPRLRWDGAALLNLLADVRGRQGVVAGRCADLGFDLRSEATARAVVEEAVQTSSIEGELLDRAEVRSSVARRLGLETAGLPADTRSVDGVVEMTLDATLNADRPLTAGRVCGWHAALFPTGFSGSTRIDVGRWRRDARAPMRVVGGGDYGRPEVVHFEAPSADRLDREMSIFLDWFESPHDDDPLLVAALAHLWFVTVHPFDDGNGRVARAVADLALGRTPGGAGRFVSMSAQIMAEQQAYYDVLESTQRGGPDVTGWMRWFLGCLGRATDRSARTLDATLRRARFWRFVGDAGGVNGRQRKVLGRMLEDDWAGAMKTSRYANLAKCSADTALRDLQRLVELGALRRNDAGGRSTSYLLSAVA